MVAQLMADGLSNREIGERLHIALSTVKGYSRIIFDKLHLKRRTEAVARARNLGLIQYHTWKTKPDWARKYLLCADDLCRATAVKEA